MSVALIGSDLYKVCYFQHEAMFQRTENTWAGVLGRRRYKTFEKQFWSMARFCIGTDVYRECLLGVADETGKVKDSGDNATLQR